MQKRLVDLEIRYTHLERQVTELSDVVFEQQRSIDALRRELTDLKSRLVEPGEVSIPEKPPHY
jgi:SlyX protein